MRRHLTQVSAWLGITGLLFFAWGLVWPAQAQSAITVIKSEQEHIFQETITFRLTAQSTSKIIAIRLFYRVSGQTSANKVVLEFDPGSTVEVEYVEDMKDDDNYQPPMVTFTYWWIIEDETSRLKTDPVSFVYEDTRYTWDYLEEDDLVRLYWHDQDQAFGQGYFDAAIKSAADLSAEFGVTPKAPVSIVIYNSHQELMSVLQEASAEWTGAVNFGNQGSIVIGLGAEAWMKRVIPHELTHAMLDQVTKPPFGDIPRWLHEGLAMRSEGGMSSEERAALDKAIDEDNLISLRVLNSAFADQRDRAILSYAESYSLISFVIDEYGTDKLGEVIAVFAEGAHYDDAMLQVFGVDMDGLEDLWRAHIGAQSRVGVTRATPVPSATSTASSAVGQTSKEGDASTSTPTATAMAAVPTATPTSTSQPTSRGPCLGAIPALALLALFVFLWPRPMR
jgi:hypothetical protein